MKRKETFKSNTLLKDLIWKHKGIDNAISTKEICNQLKDYGYTIKERALPTLIQDLRFELNLPICYQRGKGYFWAISKNDIDITINDLQNQIYALQTTINFMKGFVLGNQQNISYKEQLKKANEVGINICDLTIANELDCVLNFEYTEEQFEKLCNLAKETYLKSEDISANSIAHAINILVNYDNKTIEEVLNMSVWSLVSKAIIVGGV